MAALQLHWRVMGLPEGFISVSVLLPTFCFPDSLDGKLLRYQWDGKVFRL